MWLAFEELATSKIPAINGNTSWLLPSSSEIARTPPQGQSLTALVTGTWPTATRYNSVMPIGPSADDDADPFWASDDSWPMCEEHCDQVFSVGSTFSPRRHASLDATTHSIRQTQRTQGISTDMH